MPVQIKSTQAFYIVNILKFMRFCDHSNDNINGKRGSKGGVIKSIHRNLSCLP